MVRDSRALAMVAKGARMVLEAMRKLGQAGSAVLTAALVIGGSGCATSQEENRQAQIQNQRMDWMDKQCQGTTAAKEPITVVRSQSPLAPANQTITPITNITAADAAAARLQGEAQVRVVATIGTTPIYEREVREAVYQRLPELMSLSTYERKAKEQEMFKEELKRIIERELVLDELFAMLNGKKQTSTMNQLKDGAAKDADNRLRDIQKRSGLASDEEFKMFLRGQGLTMAGVRRHFERSFMMSAYLGERLKPMMSGINLVDLKDYYDQHGDEFMTGDKVKWQDLFIRTDRFKSQADAKKYTDWLAARAQRGEDFGKLINEFDMGDSKSRGGFGFGEERGKIFPPEVEQTVFSLKQGQLAIVEFESGYHLVRAAERTYAGKRPFDEQVQNEVRKKLQGIVSEREYRKIVDSLWRRNQPQILSN